MKAIDALRDFMSEIRSEADSLYPSDEEYKWEGFCGTIVLDRQREISTEIRKILNKYATIYAELEE